MDIRCVYIGPGVCFICDSSPVIVRPKQKSIYKLHCESTNQKHIVLRRAFVFRFSFVSFFFWWIENSRFIIFHFLFYFAPPLLIHPPRYYFNFVKHKCNTLKGNKPKLLWTEKNCLINLDFTAPKSDSIWKISGTISSTYGRKNPENKRSTVFNKIPGIYDLCITD